MSEPDKLVGSLDHDDYEYVINALTMYGFYWTGLLSKASKKNYRKLNGDVVGADELASVKDRADTCFALRDRLELESKK